MEQLGFKNTKFAGVYRSELPIFERVLLLSLNELSNEPHNAGVKYFSSKKKVKQQALQHLKSLDLISLNDELRFLISGLKEIWAIFVKGGAKMKMKYTPEEVIKIGKHLEEAWLATLTPSERLEDLKPKELLAALTPSEVLEKFTPFERMAGLKPYEIEDYLKQLKKREHA